MRIVPREKLSLVATGGTEADLWWRVTMSCFLLFVFLLQSVRQWKDAVLGQDHFRAGDWVINYSGGVIRRGFAGWLFGLLFTGSDQMLIALWVFQTVLYAIIFGVVVLWVLRAPEPGRWALVFLSPAFLLFSLGDPAGSYRKEIVVMAALAILSYAVSVGKAVFPSLVVSAVLFAFGSLSHEMNILFLAPLLVLVFWARARGFLSVRSAYAGYVMFIVGAVLGAVLAVFAPGTVSQGEMVCADLVGRGFSPGICRGSIRYVGDSVSDGFGLVVQYASVYWIYLPLAALSFLPLALIGWVRQNWRIVFVSVVLVVPLFFVALDWGRWIMVMVFIATMISYVGATHVGLAPPRAPAIFVAFYVLIWSLPHFNPLGRYPLVPGTLVLHVVEMVGRLFGS